MPYHNVKSLGASSRARTKIRLLHLGFLMLPSFLFPVAAAPVYILKYTFGSPVLALYLDEIILLPGLFLLFDSLVLFLSQSCSSRLFYSIPFYKCISVPILLVTSPPLKILSIHI